LHSKQSPSITICFSNERSVVVLASTPADPAIPAAPAAFDAGDAYFMSRFMVAGGGRGGGGQWDWGCGRWDLHFRGKLSKLLWRVGA